MKQQMSEEQIRVKVAELCNTLACPGCGWPTLECWSHDYKVPNYPRDLNACAEMEGTLDYGQKAQYSQAVYRLNKDCVIDAWLEGEHDFDGYFELLQSSALQRCLAFLAVHGIDASLSK